MNLQKILFFKNILASLANNRHFELFMILLILLINKEKSKREK